MMFIAVEVRASTILGQGLFPLARVRCGTVICSFTIDAKVITEAEYVDSIRSNHPLVVRTGTRYVGKYFTHTSNGEEALNFFNHSFEPNVVCHCGVVMALRDIAKGEELTVDYRTLIDDTETGVYNDAVTGRPIRGFSARQTLLRTAKQLVDLLESVDETWTG
jgi:SET domain-containing protein